jgi:hypothetical protein
VRCSFPNLSQIFIPFDPSRPIARRHRALKGNPNGPKKALAEIGRSYNISRRTIREARGMKKQPLFAAMHRFTRGGRLVKSWGTPGKGEGQFHLPHSIAFDDDGKLYVADRSNKRIQIFARR